jgi:outer membrane protein assembly factor BamB
MLRWWLSIGAGLVLPAVLVGACGADVPIFVEVDTDIDADTVDATAETGVVDAHEAEATPPPRTCPDAGRPVATGDPASRAVTTQHNDVGRTGAYAAERILTPSAVRDRGMHLAYVRPLAGRVDVQPLYVPAVPYASGATDTVFAATIQNGVHAYALDTGAPIWSVTLADTDAESRPLARGITGTPVIDRASLTMYVLFSTKNQALDYGHTPQIEAELAASLDVVYWLVALDLRTGAELRRVKVSASAKRGDGETVPFVAKNHVTRPALLLDHGAVSLAFGMRFREEITDYHGWVIRYDATTFAPKGAFCTSVEATVPKAPYTFHQAEGAGIWQSGSGLAADPDGNVYVATGNARADAAEKWFGDSAVKLAASTLDVAATFQPTDALRMEIEDLDLGVGGLTVVPDTRWATVAGKTGVLYMFDRATMTAVQELEAFTNTYHPDWTHGCPANAPGCASWSSGPHAHGAPTYWRGADPTHGYIYHWPEKEYLKRFRLDLATGRLEDKPLVGSVRATADLMPGGMLSLSSTGNEKDSAVIWATLPTYDAADHLYAFDGDTLEVLWDSPFPDAIPRIGKWVTPTVADGRVIIATNDVAGNGGFAVYELDPCPIKTLAQSNGRRGYQPGPDKSGRAALAKRFESEESIGALSALRRAELAPPGRARSKLSARVRACDAAATPNESLEALGTAIDGATLSVVGERAGNVFRARDGSSIEVSKFRSVASPDASGPPWELYRVTSHQGEGQLSDIAWVQRMTSPLTCETAYVFLR